jgi:hypothetical protein
MADFLLNGAAGDRGKRLLKLAKMEVDFKKAIGDSPLLSLIGGSDPVDLEELQRVVDTVGDDLPSHVGALGETSLHLVMVRTCLSCYFA